MTLKDTCRFTLAIGAIVALSLTLAGCGKKADPTSPDENVQYPRQYPRPMK